MKQSDIERFDAYLLDEMDLESRKAFEANLSDDPVFAAAFTTHLKLVQAIEEDGFRGMLQEIHREQIGSAFGRYAFLKNRWVWGIAAAIIVLISWVWLSSPQGESSSRDEMTAIKLDPGLPTTLGATDQLAFGEGMNAYKQANYAEALRQWTPLITNDPDNDTLLFYLAQIDLAYEQYAKASVKLESVAKKEASILRDKSLWYLALTKLRLGEKTEARELLRLLSQGESLWKNQAKTILEAMK